MSKNDKCHTISPLLGAYVNNCLKDEQANQVEEHLQSCSQCYSTAKALKLVLKESIGYQPDLWPSFRSRLADSVEDNPLKLKLPQFTWQSAVALAVVVCVFAVAPESWRLLIAFAII
jgi:anti-sigma factor RsiW